MRDYVYAPKDDPKHRHDWREPYDARRAGRLRAVRRRRRRSPSASPSRPGCRSTATPRRTEPRWPPRSTRWSRSVPGTSCWPSTTSRSAAGRRARPTPGSPPGCASTSTAEPTSRSSPPSTSVCGPPPTSTRWRRASRRRADRVDRTRRRQRRHHRRRRAGPRRLARRSAAAALGQLPRQRRGDGRSPLRRSASRSGTGPRGGVLGLPRQPDGARPRVDAAAGLDRGAAARRRPRGGVAHHGGRPRLAGLRQRVRRRGSASRGRVRRSRRGPRAVRRRGRVRRPRPRGRGRGWLTQIHRDARLALTALDVLDGERAVDTILGMGVRWQASRRSPTTVFGPRCSVRVLIGQADDGTWRVEPGAIEHDQNAIDALVRRRSAL